MSSTSIKAIAIGTLIDIGGTMLVAGVYTFVYAILLASQGVAPEEMERRVLADPAYYVITLTMGLAFMALGGYVAGRIARAREIMHAAWVGLIAIGISLVFVSSSDTSMYPAWYLAVSFGLTLPAALLGGYFAHRRAMGRVEAGAA